MSSVDGSVELIVLFGTLGEDCPHPVIGGVHLHHEVPAGIRNREDGGSSEPCFELLEGLLSLRTTRTESVEM